MYNLTKIVPLPSKKSLYCYIVHFIMNTVYIVIYDLDLFYSCPTSRILPEPPVSKRNEKSNKSDIRAWLKNVTI